MPIDFGQALEVAKALFSGISAASAAISAWRKSRNKQEAATTFDMTLAQVRQSPDTRKAAEELAAIIPPEVIADLERRADRCWTNFREVLGGDYLPGEIDQATTSVAACVCRELRRIYQLNGDIPPRWIGQWNKYRCDDKSHQPAAEAISTVTEEEIGV